MILPEIFFNKLDSSYQKVILELEKCIAACDPTAYDVEKKHEKNIESFSERYLIPKEYWEYLSNCNHISDSFDEWKFYEKTSSHFYFKKQSSDDPRWCRNLKLYKLKNNVRYVGWHHDDYTFSNPHVKEAYQRREMVWLHSLPKELKERADELAALFERIEAVENDDIQWVKVMQEANDHRFVCNNIEYRIGLNFLNVQLWKIYIEYLKETNPQEMLHIYSKYCRFFLDDIDMKEKYKTEMAKYGPVTFPSPLSWKNLFDFEKNLHMPDDGFDNAFMQSNEVWDDSPNFDPALPSKFHHSYVPQYFSLPKPIIKYMLEKPRHTVLKKLFQTCKFFFDQKPALICYSFRMHSDKPESIIDESFVLENSDKNLKFYKNCYITTSLIAWPTYEYDENFGSSVIPKLYQCDAKYVSIKHQNLRYNELVFLIKSGNVVYLDLDRVNVYTSENELVSLEDIIKYVPLIEKLKLYNIKITERTISKLLKQKFHSKINEFILLNISGEPFDVVDFCSFLLKIRSKYFWLNLAFVAEFYPQTFVENLKSVVKKEFSDKNSLIDIGHWK